MYWFYGFWALSVGLIIYLLGLWGNQDLPSGVSLICLIGGALLFLIGLGFLVMALMSAKSRAHDRQAAKRKAEEQELRRKWPQIVTTDSDEK